MFSLNSAMDVSSKNWYHLQEEYSAPSTHCVIGLKLETSCVRYLDAPIPVRHM